MATPNTKRNVDARADDLYTTPTEALEAIKEIYNGHLVCSTVLDPCCGLGVISEMLREVGAGEITSVDLNDWGYGETGIDFLTYQPKHKFDYVVMNPPFKLTTEFVDKALDVTTRGVVMFNRLTTLESIGRSLKFVNEWPLKEVHVFAKRVSCPEGPEMKPTANSVAYALFYFEHEWADCPKLKWIV
jgi:predicted RNA methylase